MFDLQCHKELGNLSEATNWTKLALKMTTNTSDVRISVSLRSVVKSVRNELLTAISELQLFLDFIVLKDEETSKLEAELQFGTNTV